MSCVAEVRSDAAECGGVRRASGLVRPASGLVRPGEGAVPGVASAKRSQPPPTAFVELSPDRKAVLMTTRSNRFDDVLRLSSSLEVSKTARAMSKSIDS